MSKHVDYFSDWESSTYSCSCGWSGTGAALTRELFAELLQADCPSCFSSLVLVPLPTEAAISAAAKCGSVKAKDLLGEVVGRERVRERRAESLLRSPAQLPELEGVGLEFVLDIQDAGSDRHYIITLDDLVVWRELAAWEDWERFNELKELLRDKYETRFASLTPTSAAEMNLFGDNARVVLSTT